MKKTYQVPEVDLIHLSGQERVLNNMSATGPDVTFDDPSTFDEFFNNALIF